MRPRLRNWNDDLWPTLFVAWCVLVIVRAHWPYLETPAEQNIDEGYVMAIGQRMLHGRMLPFVDGTAHSGPLFVFSGALIAAFGEFSWLPIRVTAVLCFAALPVLTFLCGRAAKGPLAGAIAAAGVPFYVTLRMDAYDAFAYNAELPALLSIFGGLYAAMRALGEAPATEPVAAPATPSMAWLSAAGVFTALAALSKQVGALVVLPVSLYVLIAVLTREGATTRERMRWLCWYCAAGAAPVLLMGSYFALRGGLADAYYYIVTYNRVPYQFPYRDHPLLEYYKTWFVARTFELTLVLAVLGIGFTKLFECRAREASWRRALRCSNFDVAVTLMAIAGVIAARASRKEFDHYWLMALPGFSLLLASLVARATSAAKTRSLSWASQAVVLLPLMLAGELKLEVRNEHPQGWSANNMRLLDVAVAAKDPEPYCQFIREHSKRGDTLFVWGFRPQLYVSCKRRPASRYVFTSFVSGWIPLMYEMPKEVEDTLTVPGSRELLIKELEDNKPPVIVDSARTLAGRGLLRYELLASYVTAHYDAVALIAGDRVWLRKP